MRKAKLHLQKRLFLLIYLLLWNYSINTPSLFGQKQAPTPFFQFEQLELPGGLQGNTVQSMVEDEFGFIWFGTINGLTRYDGRAFKRYFHNPLDSNSLISNYIECITIDHNGVFWIGSYGKGITKFNPKNNQFKRYKPIQDHPNGLNDGNVHQILEDKNGIIWIATNSGVSRLDPETDNFKHYRADPTKPNSLQNERVRALYLDKKNNLWIGTGWPWAYNPASGGLYKLNTQTEEITAYLHDPNDPTSLGDNRVGAIFEDAKDNFWVGTMGTGLQLLDRETGKFTRYPYKQESPSQLSRPWLTLDKTVDLNYSQVSFIHEDLEKKLWIGAFNGGLNVYDPVLKVQTHIEQNDPDQSGLTTNNFWDILQTEDQSIFICTAGDGGGKTYKVNYKTSQFPFYKTENDREVSYITEDKKGNIWLGFLDGQNLIKFNDLSFGVDEEKGLDVHNIEEVERVHFPDEIKQCGSILLQFTPTGIQLFDAQTNQIRVKIDTDQKETLKEHSIWIIKEDLNHDFWIASWGGGVFYVDSQKRKITHFKHDQADSTSIGGNNVSNVYTDRKGNIWLGGGQRSHNVEFPLFLDKFDPVTKTFTHFATQSEKYGFVPCMAEDKEGNIWYPTTLDGIRKLNPITREVVVVKQSNSLIPADEIRALAIDHADKIWMSTEQTIVKFDPQVNSFVVYDESDGVQINDFGFGVAFRTATGQVTFGGNNGFHIFDPLELTRNEYAHQPKIQITELQVNNQVIEATSQSFLDTPIWQKEKLTLNHQQNSFSFGINCIDYKEPNNIYLEYQLENYDKIWRKAGSEKIATYVNVPAGEYVFKVRGANSGGYWNRAGKSIAITISPPWWRTWWAYVLITGAVLSTIFGLYRFQLNKQIIQKEASQLKEIDALKTRLYGNITHEFRTPLTLIIGLSKQLTQQKSIEPNVIAKLKTIERNGHQALQLINQLLDLRKLEVGQIQLQLVQTDILPLFRYIYDNFHSYAASKDLELELDCPYESIIMDYDPNRVYETVSNLLINAIKYTPRGGEIYLSVQQEKIVGSSTEATENEPISKLIIKLKDTGIGIPDEDLPYIFDRFHQVEERQNVSGTGIGLALVKEFTELMDGAIKVKSIPNIGSEFELFLPITQKAPIVENFLKTNWMGGNFPIPIISQRLDEKELAEAPTEKELILIVEDNIEVAQFVASFLRKYNIHFATNGQEGIEKALELIPDLIISDVMMPQKNGFELCEQLKEDQRTSHIPIILLTARATSTDRLSGLKKGADAYLTKPFSDDELQLWVNNLLSTRRQLHERYEQLETPPKSTKTVGFDLTIEDAFVNKVIALIKENSTNPDYSVALLAEEVHLSSSQLHRKVAAVTGKSPIQLLRLERLSQAKILLSNKDLSISEVAYQTGFNDPSYFTRVFTKEFKIKPTAFRDKLGA